MNHMCQINIVYNYKDKQDYSTETWLMSRFELFSSTREQSMIQQCKPLYLYTCKALRLWLSNDTQQMKYVWKLWNLPHRETLTSVLVMSNSCSAHLYWCPEKFRREAGAHLQCPSSPYTLNFIPTSLLFHLPFHSFIKSAFISLHHPCPVFTSILFSSLSFSIDPEHCFNMVLRSKRVHAMSSGNAIYLLLVVGRKTK